MHGHVVRPDWAEGLEGAWWGDGGAYFVASFARTSDGSVNEHDGQVWFFDPATETVTPDGKILFANVQSSPGRVFAITGPWGRNNNH